MSLCIFRLTYNKQWYGTQHMWVDTEIADAAMIKCVPLCYASDCNTLVTTPSTTSPTLRVWATRSLSHNSQEAGRQKASSHYYTSETVSDGSTTIVTRSSLTYAAVTCDRQANTEEHQGSPGTETKYHQGKSSLTHDTLRRHSWNETLYRLLFYLTSEWQFIIPGISFNWWYQQSYSFHLYSSSAVILFPLLSCPPPTLPPLFAQLHCPSYTSKLCFFCHMNATQPESKHYTAVNPRIPFSLYSVFPTWHSALIPSFQFNISPYSIIPIFHVALLLLLHFTRLMCSCANIQRALIPFYIQFTP